MIINIIIDKYSTDLFLFFFKLINSYNAMCFIYILIYSIVSLYHDKYYEKIIAGVLKICYNNYINNYNKGCRIKWEK